MLNLPVFNKKKKGNSPINPEDNLLAIDIGTENLKTLLFNTTELGVNIKKVSRIKQQQNAMSKGKIQNLETVLENCRLAISDVTAELSEQEAPTHAVLGLAGEYVQGVSIIVNYEREEKYDSDVTQKEEARIIEKVHEQIISSGKEDLALRTGLLNEDIEILHITVTGMEIGGMNVNSLAGFRGKSVKLFFYASFAPKTYVDSLKGLMESLELELLGIVAQPFAVARAYSGARNKDFSGIFVDIGGGTTDVAVVDNGNVLDTQMFAFGGRVFTKQISNAMNLDYRHAESRKVKYSEGQLDKGISGEIKSIMYPTAELWMKTLKASLEMVDDIDSFPSQIFICGGGAMLPDIKNVMLEFPWTKLLPFTSIPKVNVFLPERLYGISDESGDLKLSLDVTPAALARFSYDKITNPDNYYYSI
jgi:cell division protein FtsA